MVVVMVGFVLRAGGVPSIIWGASGGHLTRKTKEHHKEERESFKFLLLGGRGFILYCDFRSATFVTAAEGAFACCHEVARLCVSCFSCGITCREAAVWL